MSAMSDTTDTTDTSGMRSPARWDLALGVAVGAALALVALRVMPAAGADALRQTDNLPKIIAYSGQVKLGGAVPPGDIDLRFTIYDDSDFALWSEEHEAVSLDSDGRFSVLLGAIEALTDAALTSGAIELGIDVRTSGGSYTALGGRQTIASLPRARWLKDAMTMTVAGSAFVDGVMALDGNLYVGGATCDVGGAAARLDMGGDGNGPHGVAFADASGTGAQLVYRTSPNALIVESVNDMNDGANVFNAALSDGAVDTAGAVSFASTVSTSDDLSVSPPSTATLGLDLAGGDILMGLGTNVDKYIAFKESTSSEGMQMRYSASGNAFEIESGTSLGNSTDLFTVDGDDAHTYIKGTAYVTKLVLDPGDDFTSDSTLENGEADKTWYDDSSCPIGAIAGGVNSVNQGILCVCLSSAERSRGWYCWE